MKPDPKPGAFWYAAVAVMARVEAERLRPEECAQMDIDEWERA